VKTTRGRIAISSPLPCSSCVNWFALRSVHVLCWIGKPAPPRSGSLDILLFLVDFDIELQTVYEFGTDFLLAPGFDF
jgi:hypothetical protein